MFLQLTVHEGIIKIRSHPALCGGTLQHPHGPTAVSIDPLKCLRYVQSIKLTLLCYVSATRIILGDDKTVKHFRVENKIRRIIVTVEGTVSLRTVKQLSRNSHFYHTPRLLSNCWFSLAGVELLRVARDKPLEPSFRYLFRHQMALAIFSVQTQ